MHPRQPLRTQKAIAEARRFEQDLFGPSSSGESESEPATAFVDLFDEIGRGPTPEARALRSRGQARSRRRLALPPAAEQWETSAPAPVAVPPFPTNCTTISAFRRVPLQTEAASAVTAATATTPPVNAIAATAVPAIADFDTLLPAQVRPAGPGAFLVENTGSALIDTGHFRVDPADATRFQVRVKGQLCHPARVGDPTKLPEGTGRLPVVVIIHGQHAAIDFNLTDTGGPRRTVPSGSGTATVIPARANIAFEVANHLGYTDLQTHLAEQGIVSVSIDTNAANVLGSLMAFRAELGLAMLDQLRTLDRDATSALHARLDFTKVGVIGHSRGGDAVATLALRNSQRPVARRFGIRSVVQIAPTDFTGMTRAVLRMNKAITDSFLVVYGSHDGDVSGAFDPSEISQAWGFGGTGFRHYDRSGTQRAMVFIHGATHNRFNSVWIDPARHRAGSPARALAEKQADNPLDAVTVDPALPVATTDPPAAGERDRRVLSAAAHATLMREYIGGWLFKQLQGSTASAALFDGSGTNSLSTPVSLQWTHGRTVRTIDFFDDANPRRSDIGGASTAPAFVTEQLIELSQPANIPHHDRVLLAQAPTGALRVYTTTIPSGKRDVSTFTHLTFRMSKVFPDVTTPAKIAATAFPATIDVALFDGTNRRAVNAAALATLNPRVVRPYHRITGGDNLTKVELQTFAVPLARFTGGSGGVTLSSVQAIELTFNATAGQDIHLDTPAFVRL
jgi:hypothetical protein